MWCVVSYYFETEIEPVKQDLALRHGQMLMSDNEIKDLIKLPTDGKMKLQIPVRS